MKKIFLFAASMLLSMSLMASDDYTLQIEYRENPGDPTIIINVDNTNANDILGDGTMHYDAEYQVLQLAGVNLNGTIWYKTGTGDEDKLTIEVYGENILNVDNIESSGAIYAEVGTLTIVEGGSMPATLRISRTNNTYPSAAITAGKGGAGKLILQHLSVVAICENSNAIKCNSLDIEGTMTFLDAIGGSGFTAISCSYGNISLSSYIAVAYYTHNSVISGHVNGNHQIFASTYKIQDYDGVLVQGQNITNFTEGDIFQNEAGDTWDNEKRILTLNGDDYLNNDVPPFFAFSAPATLAFVGPSKNITSNNSPVITTSADLTITGAPEVSLYSSDDRAIAIEPDTKDVTLTFDCANILEIKSNLHSIDMGAGGSTHNANVVFKSSKVQDMHNVQDLAGFSLVECHFTNPDLWFNGDEIWDDAMGSAATSIQIDASSYPIIVGNFPVFPYNKSDVLGNGLVSYDSEKNVLTIKDDPSTDEVSTGSNPAIEVIDTDLTIRFIGTHGSVIYVRSEDSHAIKMWGTGHTLTLINDDDQFSWVNFVSNNNVNYAAIEAEGNDIVFSGQGHFIVSDTWASGTDCPLINAKTVTINSPLYLLNDDNTDTHDVIAASDGLFLHDFIWVTFGYNVDYNVDSHQLEWQIVTTDAIREIEFEVKALDDGANLAVMGIYVNPFNASDILRDGTVSYNDLTSTLTLKKASLIPEYVEPISFASPTPLTIALQGENVIKVPEMVNAIYADGELTIRGNGKLDIEVDANDGYTYAICAMDKLAVLDKAAVNVATINKANQPAILIQGGDGELEVDDADLRVSVDNASLVAINCMRLSLGTDVTFRHDDGDWKEVSWDGGSGFTGADLSHIWIGKNADFPTDIENTFAPSEKAVKVLMNGQLFIIRGEHIYNMQGQTVL